MSYRRIAWEVALALLLAPAVWTQQSGPTPDTSSTGSASVGSDTTTIQGCLDSERGNYIVVERTGIAYVLKGVGNKLDSQLHHEVAVKGRILPGSIKAGVRPEKAGSNPSDTLHGVDGTPFQVDDVKTDVRVISKRCKASD